LVQVVAARVIPITTNSNHGLQFKDISITTSTPGPFGPDPKV